MAVVADPQGKLHPALGKPYKVIRVSLTLPTRKSSILRLNPKLKIL